MTVPAKPAQWDFSVALTDQVTFPNFWKDALFVLPLWEGEGQSIQDLVSGLTFANINATAFPAQWVTEPYGLAFQGSGVYYPGDGTGFTFSPSAPGHVNASVTYLYYGRCPPVTSGFYVVMASAYNDTSLAMGGGLSLAISGPGFGAGFTDNGLNPGDQSVAGIDTGFVAGDNVIRAYGVAYDYGTNMVSVYIGETLYGVFGFTPAEDGPNPVTDALWGNLTSGCVAVLSGVISATDYAQWARDPFGPLRPQPVIEEVTPFRWLETIYSQYANSPVLLKIIEDFSDNIDPTDNIASFYNLLWNVDTAEGYGLDVWGRIVGVSRVLKVATSKFLGFDEMGSLDIDPFNQSPFYTGQKSTQNFPLTDDAFRTLILAKAAANITNCSVPAINAILRTLFPGQDVYVTDNQDMSLTYTFKGFLLTPVQVSIVETSGVLPKPTGVFANYAQV